MMLAHFRRAWPGAAFAIVATMTTFRPRASSWMLPAALLPAMLATGLAACGTTVDSTPVAISCDDYDDGEPEKHVDVVIENQSDDWVYFGSLGCRATPRFDLYEDGERVDLLDGPCAYSCEDLQTSPNLGCTADCAIPDVVAIAPGGHYAMSWSGLVSRHVAMPASCHAEPAMSTPTCAQLVPAPAKTFEVGAQLFARLDCGVGGCACIPNEQGHCLIAGHLAGIVDDGYEARVSFDHPATDVALIAVTGSVGCPAAPPADGGACLVEGTVCPYEETDPCGHALDPTASCEEGAWVVGANAVACDKTCPAEAPTEGAGCDEATDGSHCEYPVDGCQATMACATDAWTTIDTVCGDS